MYYREGQDMNQEAFVAKKNLCNNTLSNFKQCLSDWLATHRQRIWTGSDESDSLIDLLASYGIMIPTQNGAVKLSDLTRGGTDNR